DAFDQSGRHHPPADGALQATERQNPDQLRLDVPLEPAGQPEEGERQGEDDADAARQHAMRPLPPEDELERIETHAPVDLLVFGNLAVLVELLLPFGIVHRRDYTVDRLPFG